MTHDGCGLKSRLSKTRVALSFSDNADDLATHFLGEIERTRFRVYCYIHVIIIIIIIIITTIFIVLSS